MHTGSESWSGDGSVDNGQLLKTTIDSSLDMIQVFKAVRNDEGTIIDFVWVLNNATSIQIYGDVIGKSLLTLQPAVVEEGIFDAFKQVVETGVPQQYEKHYVHEQFDGWFYQSVVKLNDGVATTTANITHLKKAEEELKAAKESLQATLDSSPFVIQAFQAVRNVVGAIVDFTWTFTNKNWNQLYGDVLGKRLLQQNPGVVETGLFEQFVQVTETGMPVNQEQYYSHEQFHDQWFHQTLVKMGDGFVMNTEDITERKRLATELLRLKDAIASHATDRYFSLFNSIDEGFAILELIFDENGKPVDFLYQETNPAFVKHVGVDLKGKRRSELDLDRKDFLLEKYEQLARTGESFHFEYCVQKLEEQWFQVTAVRIGGEGSRHLGAIFRNITERKNRERRQAFLLKLSDELRPLANPMEIQKAATQLLGLELGASRVFYVDVAGDGDTGTILFDYVNGVSSRTGTYSISSLSSQYLQKWKDGIVAGTSDVLTDPLFSDSERAQYLSLSTRAGIGLPLVKERKLVAILGVNYPVPHEWTGFEMDLMTEVAERTWAAVERTKAEEALRQSEEKYRSLFNSIDEGFCITEMLYDEAGNPVDYRYIEVNKSHERLTGLKDVVGKTGKEVTPGDEWYWIQAFDKVVQTGEAIRFENYHQETRRWYEAYVSPMGRAERRQVAIVFNDITQRKRFEIQLKENYEQIQLATKAAKAGWGYRNFITGEAYWDEQGKIILGFPNEEDSHSEEGWKKRVHPEDLPLVEALMAECIRQDKSFDLEYRVIRADGETRFVHAMGVFSKDEKGTLLKGGGLVMDITERRQREQRQAFLLKFSDTLRALSEEKAIEEAGLRMLAGYLKLDRVYIFVLYPASDRAVVKAEYRKDDLISILGEVRMSDFPETVRQIEDETIVFNDIDNDERLSDLNRISLHAVDLQAFVCASVRKGERVVIGSLAAANVTPRVWTKDEVELIEIVAERIWAAAERARTEEALRQSQKRFQSIANLVPDLLWESGPDGATTWYNQRWLEYTGQSLEQAIGWGWVEAIHPDDREGSAARYHAAVATGKPMQQEHRIRRYDGEYRWFIVSTYPLKDASGRVVKVYGAATDVNDRIQAQEALQQVHDAYRIKLEQEVRGRTLELIASRDELEREQHFLEQVTDKAPLLIYVYDLKEGRFTYINKRVEELIGKSEEYIYAMGPHLFQAILHPEDLSRYMAYMQRLKDLSGGQVTENDFRVWNGTQFRWFRSRDSVFREETSHVRQVIGIAEDITYEKMLEEKMHTKGPIGLN